MKWKARTNFLEMTRVELGKKITGKMVLIFNNDSPFTVVAKLFFTRKNSYFVNVEVMAGCPNLGHTTLNGSYFHLGKPQKSYFLVVRPLRGGGVGPDH